jgi:uncharacterized protein YwgA
MTRYQLGKIVEWAGTLQSRKRMQKLVFLLQAAGCPLDVDYDLHHYGPYSEDLARLTDLMVDERLLEERMEVRPYGEQYSYRLSPESIRQIAEYESRLANSGLARPMAAFEPLARSLCETDLKELEVASTIVFFRAQGNDWPAAVEKACQFKDLPTGAALAKKTEELARRFVG